MLWLALLLACGEGDTSLETDTDTDTDIDTDTDTDADHDPQVLNGDFEEWEGSGGHQENLSNDRFTSLMPHATAFGDYDELDVYGDDGYVSSRGGWVVAAGAHSGKTDAFSLELSEPLRKGQTYTISFAYAYAYYEPHPELGLSDDPAAFGTLVASPPPPTTSWSEQSVSFEAPHSGQYLTVRNADLSQWQWCFWDDLSIEVGG